MITSNPIVSHAQQFEDIMLWRALKDVEHGVYVDIGASDPVSDSVSLLFYEQGWRGVHVEPSPRLAELLRGARPDEMVIEAVAGNGRQRLVTFHECVDPAAFGLGTIELPHLQTIQAHGFQTREYTVPVVTLDDVFRRIKATTDVHWLKIDVDGSEKRVLEGWQGDCRPWIVMLECVSVLSHDENYQEWEKLLLAKNYIFAWTDQLNRYYVHCDHVDLVASLQIGLSVFDGFQISAQSSFFTNASTKFHQELKHLQEESETLRIERDNACAECSAVTAQRDEIFANRAEIITSLMEATTQCNAFRSSRSWRITGPLRFMGRILRGIKQKFKAVIKSPFLALILLVRRYRPINNLALFCLRLTPRFKERLRVLELANKAPATVPPSFTQALSPYEKSLYDQLWVACEAERRKVIF